MHTATPSYQVNNYEYVSRHVHLCNMHESCEQSHTSTCTHVHIHMHMHTHTRLDNMHTHMPGCMCTHMHTRTQVPVSPVSTGLSTGISSGTWQPTYYMQPTVSVVMHMLVWCQHGWVTLTCLSWLSVLQLERYLHVEQKGRLEWLSYIDISCFQPYWGDVETIQHSLMHEAHKFVNWRAGSKATDRRVWGFNLVNQLYTIDAYMRHHGQTCYTR